VWGILPILETTTLQSLQPRLSSPTSVKLLCYANLRPTHEPRIRVAPRQKFSAPHSIFTPRGFSFLPQSQHDCFAVQAGTSGLDGHASLERGRLTATLLSLRPLPTKLSQTGRAPALQKFASFHHPVFFGGLWRARARPVQGRPGIQHRDCRALASGFLAGAFLGA